MKTFLLFLTVLTAFAAGLVQADEPRRGGTGPEVLPPGLRPPAHDLPGDAELKARRNAAGALTPKPVPLQWKGYGIAELSQFVGQGKTFAIVPKGSVLFCPEALAARVLARPSGTLMPWPEFLVANRNWIATREVTLAQVRGEAPLTEIDRKAFASAGHLVIATLRGNPVTVLVPPTPTQP